MYLNGATEFDILRLGAKRKGEMTRIHIESWCVGCALKQKWKSKQRKSVNSLSRKYFISIFSTCSPPTLFARDFPSSKMTFKRLSSSFYLARGVHNGFVQLVVSGVSSVTNAYVFALVGGALQQDMTRVQLQSLTYCKTRRSDGFISSCHLPSLPLWHSGRA